MWAGPKASPWPNACLGPPMAEPRLFALPLGTDFPKALVAGLIERMRDHPPEAMARVRLYVNSGRMQRRVREEFDRHGARLLPRIRLVTDLGRDPLAGTEPAVPPLRRRLELARLVDGLSHSLPDFAPGRGHFDLADSLATLLAEMQHEGVTPEALERLDIAETHAEHWRRSLAFIRIVTRYFERDALPDPDGRQRRIVEHLVRQWQDAPPADPVIIAGSTGSRGATSLLMQAVAGLKNGYVVLPGFDFSMPAAVWNSLCSGAFPAEDHPQYRFAALMRALDLGPGQVTPWLAAPEPSARRNALISLALRPAPVTDQWMQEGRSLRDLPGATQDLTLIEAPDPRQEALAIALVLREAAETGTEAALITPDRMLARRVTAALDRWGILPDDSAGEPLSLTAAGRFLRHVAGAMGRRLTLEQLLVLLKHPLTATGSALRGPHLRFTRELELHLRRHGPAFPDAASLQAWAARSDEQARHDWVDWLGACIDMAMPAEKAPLSACIETHMALAGSLAAGPGGSVGASELWAREPGQEALRVFQDLIREAPAGGDYSPAQYTDLVQGLLRAGQVRAASAGRSGILILGTLEARVLSADLVVLAGLNEGVWPAMPAPDPWLSRRMRLESGLLLPERLIGLSAHDFQRGIAAPRVVLSRARRDADAETVPSRWLNRLTNLLRGLPDAEGPEALAAMEARGRTWLGMARTLDRPTEVLAPARRPSPRPPATARPRELPVTAIKTLIRDPYAVYAERILRLRPLDPLLPEPDPRLRGQVLHRIIERFVRERPAGEAPGPAEARLMRISEEVLGQEIPWPSAQRLWLARIGRISAQFIADEALRAREGSPAVIERKGALDLRTPAFRLTATPDRIDLLHDGSVHVLDYKSGRPPTEKQVDAFDKQLLLEAVMVERGAFPDLGPCAVSRLSYVHLGGEGLTAGIAVTPERIAETQTGLTRLIAAYLREETGFTARRALESVRQAGNYDHLSRFGEWDMSDAPAPEDLG